MPKWTARWVSRELHPAFQLSLPEGFLRDLIIRNFSNRFDCFGDLELLAVIGENMIGRIQVTPHGQALSGLTARAAGLTVPEVHLSEDRKHLLAKRFDLAAEGKRMGFEDMCALLGLPARERFTGSVERVIKTIATYCHGGHIKRSYDHFFGRYLLALTIRNGDAHLKKFGLMYGEMNSAALAPTYDMLSISVYAPLLGVNAQAKLVNFC